MTEKNPTSESIIEQLLPVVRSGGMLILVDDEDRENEGDLFVAAERATPEAINFMAAHARGLVSLALTEGRMRELGLALIADEQGNQTKCGTACATKMKAVRRFFEEGDKVKITLRFRGREMAHQDLGMKLLERVRTEMAEVSKVEAEPLLEGRQMTMVMAPR